MVIYTIIYDCPCCGEPAGKRPGDRCEDCLNEEYDNEYEEDTQEMEVVFED